MNFGLTKAWVGISGTTAKSCKCKFVPSSHTGPFAIVASSRKSQTKISPLKRGTYYQYPREALERAFTAVKEEGSSVNGAAKKFGVPVNTLRDRLIGKISVDVTCSGQPPLFNHDEEALIAEHIMTMANLGYGYTRSEVVGLASKFAVDLGKREEGSDDLSMPWYYNFMKRWPDLDSVKPKSLSELRARAASKDSIDTYYAELDRILTDYNLKDKPECIYSVDEICVKTGAGKVVNTVAPKGSKAQTVTSERGETVTVIGCGNAGGASIPPYLVFPGKVMFPELLKGATPGCDGTVGVTEKGYSNADAFSGYVRSHFFKYVQERDPDQHVLLLYDGHRSHISLSLIEWAKQNKIILFVLPPNTSHILQPIDVGCFGPFEGLYQAEVEKFTSKKAGTSMTIYDICGPICKAYNKALQGDNLREAFRRTGIYAVSIDEDENSDENEPISVQMMQLLQN